VAAMDAATAFAAWNRFLTDPVIRAGEDLTA
jgi:hypothetical protein